MNRIKILHVFHEIKFSGAEIMYFNALNEFIERGCDIEILATGKSVGDFAEAFEKRGISIFHIPFSSRIFDFIVNFSSFVQFFKLLRSRSYRVLHIHRSDIYLLGVIAYFLKIKVIKTLHSIFRHRLLTYPYGFLQRRITATVFKFRYHSISDSVYKNELVYYKNKTTQINNWVDPSFFNVTFEQKEAVRIELGIPAEAFVVITVGSCTEIKRHQHIIQAIKELPPNINCYFLHLGSGPLEQEERRLVKCLEIDNKVFFIGNTNNVKKYLLASDVFVMTSKVEGIGIAALEAMAVGLPVILYDVPGLSDLIVDNDCGYLIPESPSEIAKAIRKLFHDRALCVLMGSKGKSRVKSKYSLSKSVEQMVDLYNRV
jgi:glycosyltransferase involved in cell wall biosynthesis